LSAGEGTECGRLARTAAAGLGTLGSETQIPHQN